MPNYYAPYYYPQQQQMMPAPQMQTQVQQQTPIQNTQQIQNGGFVSVRNETEARSYPVAPGNSITFKDETAPYVYTKTMGFSQLDRPIFEKFKLVKEEASEPSDLPQKAFQDLEPINDSIDALKSKIEAIEDEIEGIKKKISIKPIAKKRESAEKEVTDDE